MATDKAEVRNEVLSGREVLTGVYRGLLARHVATEVVFPSPVESEVADDSDWQSWGSNRKGFTSFDRAAVITVNGKKWVLALATDTSGYAADNVGGELKAFRVEGDVDTDTLRTSIGRKDYYEDAALVAMADGELVIGRSVFNSIADDVKSETESLTHEEHPYTYETGIRRTVRYDPEATELVTSKLADALANLSK